MQATDAEIVIIGAGIVGLATARSLVLDTRSSVTVLEAEKSPALHQTGHNSGVIHSGLYYRPGSLKALNCIRGRESLYRYCAEKKIPYQRCGKVVVATAPEQLASLDALRERGSANGLEGLERLDARGIERIEPHVRGLAGLFVPQTGIVDYSRVANAMADDVREHGGRILTEWPVRRVGVRSDGARLESDGRVITARYLVNCAGLQSDRVARMCGLDPDVRIVPFRGEYFRLHRQREGLIRHLVYPVPDPRVPFLGVHFTRMIGGGVEAGPNAVLALSRHGYGRLAVRLQDAASIAGWAGFWRLARRYWRVGLAESYRSWSRRAFVRALNALVPELTADDIERHGSGVRAQAVTRDGRLLDDFHIVDAPRMLHVLNAPSPAATASLSIGETLAGRAADRFGLRRS